MNDEDFEKFIAEYRENERRTARNDKILYVVVAAGIAVVIGLVIAAYWF